MWNHLPEGGFVPSGCEGFEDWGWAECLRITINPIPMNTYSRGNSHVRTQQGVWKRLAQATFHRLPKPYHDGPSFFWYYHQHTFFEACICTHLLRCNTHKRYLELARRVDLRKRRKPLKILEKICEGYLNLLRWFLGRGRSNLGWSLLVYGIQKLLHSGNLQFLFREFLVWLSCPQLQNMAKSR